MVFGGVGRAEVVFGGVGRAEVVFGGVGKAEVVFGRGGRPGPVFGGVDVFEAAAFGVGCSRGLLLLSDLRIPSETDCTDFFGAIS